MPNATARLLSIAGYGSFGSAAAIESLNELKPAGPDNEIVGSSRKGFVDSDLAPHVTPRYGLPYQTCWESP